MEWQVRMEMGGLRTFVSHLISRFASPGTRRGTCRGRFLFRFLRDATQDAAFLPSCFFWHRLGHDLKYPLVALRCPHRLRHVLATPLQLPYPLGWQRRSAPTTTTLQRIVSKITTNVWIKTIPNKSNENLSQLAAKCTNVHTKIYQRLCQDVQQNMSTCIKTHTKRYQHPLTNRQTYTNMYQQPYLTSIQMV